MPEPSAQELDEIKRYIEEAEIIDVVSDEVRQLVEKHWPWLISKLPPRDKHRGAGPESLLRFDRRRG